MIDFKNPEFLKLKPVGPDDYPLVKNILIEGEYILLATKSVRDGVVFTNKRVVSVNVQGITGKKVDYTSLPYSKVSAFSVETAGVLDLDSELEMWFAGLGKVRFEFISKADITGICRMISAHIL